MAAEIDQEVNRLKRSPELRALSRQVSIVSGVDVPFRRRDSRLEFPERLAVTMDVRRAQAHRHGRFEVPAVGRHHHRLVGRQAQ